jgi:hypothetical protein
MKQQHLRRRGTAMAAARALAIGGAVATLAATLAAGQALAGVAVPDERVLERQGRIDRQADEQQAEEGVRRAPPRVPREFFQPEPQLPEESLRDLEQPAPAPPPAPDSDGPGLAVPAVLAALVLALAALATWRVRRRRPPGPDPTTRPAGTPARPLTRAGSPSHPAAPPRRTDGETS